MSIAAAAKEAAKIEHIPTRRQQRLSTYQPHLHHLQEHLGMHTEATKVQAPPATHVHTHTPKRRHLQLDDE